MDVDRCFQHWLHGVGDWECLVHDATKLLMEITHALGSADFHAKTAAGWIQLLDRWNVPTVLKIITDTH